MKPETIMLEKIREIVPSNSDRNIFFAAITQTSYEVFFYSFIDGMPKQCFSLAEEGLLDANALDSTFEFIVNTIKGSKIFKPDKLNIATIYYDKACLKMDTDHYDNDVRLYKIKKDWLRKNIS